MDELKEAFDYQADSHIFLGSPQPMLRDMRFDDVSMPPEPDDAPVEKRGDRRQRREDIKAVPPKYNEDQLAVMPEWIGASKKMFSVMNDGERFIGSDKQAAAYGLDLMSEFNWNMTGPAGIPGESGISVPGFAFQVAALMSDTAGEENAMTFLQMLHTYSDTSTNGATIKRAFRGIFADPLTYAGGFGKLYAMAAKSLAGKVSGAVLKDMLMKTAAGTAMPYDLAVKYPGRTGMVAGAGYGAGFEGGTMAVEDAAGLEPTVGEAATRLGTAGTVGAAVGGVGSKVLSKAIPAAGSAVRQGLDTAGQAAEARMAERGPITDRVMSGADPMEVIDPALAAAGKLVRQPQAEANPNRISTRLPTAKGATEDPIAQPLQIGLDEVAADPVVFEHNVGIVKNYPNMTEAEAALPPAEASEAFIEHAKNNLLWVFDKVPEQTRERSKKWYDGARAITDKWSEKYNLPDSSIAGVLAALSPQKDWYMNVSLGERVLDIMSNQQDTVFTKEMLKTGLEKFNKPQDQAIIKAISNKKLSELELPAEKAIWLRLHDETYGDRSHQIVSPEGDFIGTAMTGKGEPKGTGWGSIVEISKAVSAFESGGDKNVLTPLMGTKHKVRSFYNNILDPNGPNGDVTIDTHAVAAALLRPLSGQATEVHHNFGSSPAKAKQGADWLGATKNSAKTGVQGNYGLYAEAYRRAAAERGVLPREMQSITWEAVRGLFTDKFKGQAKNVEDVNNIWYKYRKGEVTLDEARNAVEQRAGGINPPTWQRPSGAVDEQIQNTAE